MRYIEIVEWETFQHYKKPDPAWIKSYVRLLRKDEYLDLTSHRRALLHGLWLLYAGKRQTLPEVTAPIARALNLQVTRRDLEALANAGFIRFCSRPPLENPYNESIPEAEAEKEKEVNGNRHSLPKTGAVRSSDETAFALSRLIAVVPEATQGVLEREAKGLSPAAIRKVAESAQDHRGQVGNLAGYVVNALRSERNEAS